MLTLLVQADHVVCCSHVELMFGLLKSPLSSNSQVTCVFTSKPSTNQLLCDWGNHLLAQASNRLPTGTYSHGAIILYTVQAHYLLHGYSSGRSWLWH